ncbi:MAG: hypothetical protein RL563_783 [Pseudomonadota bacterium]|jgi:hypothetical protein
MPFFIIFNLAFGALSYLESPYLPLMVDENLVLVAALCALTFLLLGGCLSKLSSASWQDGAACSGLVVWYAYWPPEFSSGSPVFIAVPFYFAVLSSWILWALVLRAPRFDQETCQRLLHLQKLMRFDPRFIASLMLISLAFPEHYLTYPLLTTLFIVRASLQCCFEVVQSMVQN